MSKFLVFVTISILVLASFPANACHNIRPDQANLQRYQSIFVGEVTGIRLTGLENKRLRKPDVCDIEKDGKIGECFNLTGGDEPTTIFSIPSQVVNGSVAGVQELEQAGCSDPSVTLRERGIFFVNPDGGSAVIVWESNKSNFAFWLERLSIIKDGR